MDTEMKQTRHRFEDRGLGKAPFTCIGFERSVFQAIKGDPSCPTQPGTCCDYCKTAIMNVYWIRSSDNKTFKVGSECVFKTGDSKLKKVVRSKLAENRRSVKLERERYDIERSQLALNSLKNYLRTIPHPNNYFADQGKTRLDWIEFLINSSSHHSKLIAANYINNLKEEQS